jgi:hypothetical protein
VALAALAAAALAALAWWLEVERPRRQARALENASRLLVDTGSVTALTIEQAGLRHVLRPVGDGSWTVRSTAVDRELVADRRAVDMALESLARARAEVLSDEAGDELAAFGLQPPKLRLAWETPGGGGELAIGDPVPPTERHAYALRGGALVTVPRSVLAATAWGLDHWRLKVLLRFDPDELARITVERPRDRLPRASERLVLAADDEPQGMPGGWRVVEPFDAPAHPARLPSRLGRLGRLVADGFGPEEPTAEELARAGLDPPAAIATLEMRSGASRVLRLGDPRVPQQPPEGAAEREVLYPAWARVDDGPLVVVRPDLAESLLAPDDFLRDNRAFPVPQSALVGFVFEKPSTKGPPWTLELYREPGGDWRAARPADAAVPQDEVARLLGALDEVQFGRFEDAIAADPSGFETAYDLSGRDTFRIEGRAIGPDGRTAGVTVEAAPPGAILRDRTPYRPVLVVDQAGRRTVGVAAFRAFDVFLDRARELRERVQEATAARDDP